MLNSTYVRRYTSKPEYESLSPMVNILGNIWIAEPSLTDIFDNILIAGPSLTVSEWVSEMIPITKAKEEQEEMKLPERLTNPNYGSAGLDAYLQEATANVVSIEVVRKITDKLPSLTKILLDIRHYEQ